MTLAAPATNPERPRPIVDCCERGTAAKTIIAATSEKNAAPFFAAWPSFLDGPPKFLHILLKHNCRHDKREP